MRKSKKFICREPPPWLIDGSLDECFIVRDANGHVLAYVYCGDEPGRRAAAKMLTRNEARRIAANIAKPVVLSRDSADAAASDVGQQGR